MIGRIEELLRLNREKTSITDFKNAAYIIFKSVEEIVHGIKVFGRFSDEEALLSELVDMI